ncbi:MAG: tetratricopeptide repeat protein [Longimicrobiales bacterium]|nr:tetratricopeptide repeat protein [Longimicrobiales bacterium]
MADSPLRRLARFFGELKRRKVYQVTAVYVVLAVGVLELLDLLVPATTLPGWAGPLILSLALVGLPVVLVLAWTFDITPSGVVRTPDEERRVRRSEGSVDVPSTHATVDPATVGGTAPEGEGRPASRAEPPPHPRPVSPGGPRRSREGGPGRGDEPVGAGSSRTAPLDPLTIAVLPFDNLSGSDDAEPFVVGLHDDLLTELSRASALTVISRTSVRGYRGSSKTLPEIARELGSGTIVEGGVQKVGDRVRLNIQLIDARTDVHRWAERYDCELTAQTIFDLQSRLASRIMEALETQLTSAERARSPARPTDDLEAYRLYSLGREAAVTRSGDGLRRAIDYFEGALDRDPTYAHAWAALGIALIMLVGYGHAEDRELVERGRVACFRAVELDPELPEAHAAVGNLHGHFKDAPAARAALSVAIRLGPGLAIGHQRAGWVHLMAGDPEHAAEASRVATHLAPLEPEARSNLAMATLALGDLEQAEAEARRALESHPDFSYGRWVLGLSILSDGRLDEARTELGHIPEERYRPWARMVDGLQLAREGDARAEEVVEALHRGHALLPEGIVRAARGDLDGALTAMASARPFFWDEVLVLRYWRGGPMAAVRRSPEWARLVTQLDAEWGVDG